MNINNLKKYLPVGSLGISLILHLAIFFAVSGVILIQAVTPKVPFSAGEVSSQPLAEPPPEPVDDDAPVAPVTDTEVADDAPSQPSLNLDNTISSNVVTNAVFNVAPSVNFSMSSGREGGGATGSSGSPSAPRTGSVSPFGSSTPFSDAMNGSIYDLKKNTAGKAVTGNTVPLAIEAFTALLKNKGAQSVLDRKYYKAPTMLYASSMYIPPMPATRATEAFKCEHLVSCPGWLAYYEGWMTPPVSGEYRFAGFADDDMLVFVDGKPVLFAFWHGQSFIPLVNGKLPKEVDCVVSDYTGHTTRYHGPWLRLEKGTAYKIVIVISEANGGIFSATLGVQQRGAEKQQALPVFKLSGGSLPEESQRWKGGYTAEGLNFGLSANGVKPPGN